MATETVKTLRFTKNTNLPGKRFYAGGEADFSAEQANKILAYRTKDDEPVAREVRKDPDSPSLENFTRDDLNAKADEAGIENAAQMSNKGEVIAALLEKGVSE